MKVSQTWKSQDSQKSQKTQGMEGDVRGVRQGWWVGISDIPLMGRVGLGWVE